MEESADNNLQEPLLRSNESNRQRRTSRNIPLTLCYMFLRCAGEAVWYGSVLSAYVYILRPENAAIVGYLSALEGLTQFVAASIAGVIADLYRRDTLLKISCVVGVLASFLTFLSSSQDSRGPFWWCLICAMPLWGTFDGIGLTASMALFADSIPDGKRSYYFTLRTVLTGIGSVVGPVCALIMFMVFGNNWTISACSKVICVAQVSLLPAFALLCFFRDEDTPAAVADEEQSPSERNMEDPTGERDIMHISNGASQIMVDAEEQPLTEDVEPDSSEEISPQESCLPEQATVTATTNDCLYFGMTKPRFIAVSAAVSDVVCAFANGMSFRYFAVFFLENLKLSPVMVQVLDAVGCLSGSGLLLLTQRIALYMGRCSVSVAFKTTGVVFLVLMNVLSLQKQHNIWMVCSLYIIQMSFLNSTQALTRSLVMDNVPSDERAKWSALESINIFGWCGSAAIGGFLVHTLHGVIPVFFISAALQMLGCVPLIGLIGVENLES